MVWIFRNKMTRAAVAPSLDPVISILVDKVADGGARIRDSAGQGIETLLASPAIGPPMVSVHALKALNAKQKSAWRIVLTRLELFIRIVQQYGMGQASGLSPESIMNFIRASNGFAHSNVEVRDAAKLCSVEVYKVIGADAMLPYLKDLRKKQLEEYELAFQEASSNPNKGGGPPAAKKSAVGKNDEEKTDSSRRVSQQQQQEQEAERVPPPVNKKGTEPKNTEARTNDKNKPEVKEEYSKCMFCGAGERGWNEDSLDMHYWKDCPLLTPCPGCAQIVEITGLPEHQLDECEKKDSYVPCEVTGTTHDKYFATSIFISLLYCKGLAVKADEMTAWRKSKYCQSPPDGQMCCPMCLEPVEDTDEAWKLHLSRSCPRNPRVHK